MRPLCANCERPTRVCLCSELPALPFVTRTKVVVLQHPHERRHKLSTVPIIARCLSNCHVIVGRRLQPETSELFDSLVNLSSCSNCSGSSTCASAAEQSCRFGNLESRVLLLFPSAGAQNLDEWLAVQHYCRDPHANLQELVYERDRLNFCSSSINGEHGLPLDLDRSAGISHLPNASEEDNVQVYPTDINNLGEKPQIILLVVDGTWQHAKEMVQASFPYLKDLVVQVCLPYNVKREGCGMFDADILLRKEPYEGYVTTMEAVARAIAVLEPGGETIKSCLLNVLRKMVALQLCNVPTMNPRPKLKRTSLKNKLTSTE